MCLLHPTHDLPTYQVILVADLEGALREILLKQNVETNRIQLFIDTVKGVGSAEPTPENAKSFVNILDNVRLDSANTHSRVKSLATRSYHQAN